MIKALKAVIVLLLTFLTISAIYTIKTNAEPTEYNFEVNANIDIPEIDMQPSHTYVLDHNCCDVNGDGIDDNVVLAGYKPGGPKEVYSEEIYLFIQDGKTRKFIRVSPGEINAGYDPRLFLGDFNGDRVSEIFVSIRSEEGKGTSTYRLISFKAGKAEPLFDEKEFSEGLKFKVEYKDDFKVAVLNEEKNNTYLIDISEKKDDYIRLGIYNADGGLLKKISDTLKPYSELKPEDEDWDGIYSLKGFQEITGAANDETIAYVESEWKFTVFRFELIDVRVVPLKK